MDRAAVGLGAVFLHLRSELNYHRLFEAEIERFSLDELSKRARARRSPSRGCRTRLTDRRPRKRGHAKTVRVDSQSARMLDCEPTLACAKSPWNKSR